MGQAIQHKNKKLYEATFHGITKPGRIAVKYNCAAPWGVHVMIDYFKPNNIELGKGIGK